MTKRSPPHDEDIPEGMDERIRDIQPGGGVIIHLEKTWGRFRRWWLKTFHRRYVAKMIDKRVGRPDGVPHEVLDPRDLKLYRNQTECYWKKEDDPFCWRDSLPFARCGLAELIVFTVGILGLFVLTAVLFSFTSQTIWRVGFGLCLVAFFVCEVLVLWFFRNPRRTIPTGSGIIVSPADGTVAEVAEVDHPMLGGQAIEIGIFLSIFNVHINRSPVAGRVVGIRYQPGKFLNALRPESARENEQISLLMEEKTSGRRLIVRQITGAIARRIVCWVRPGEWLDRGEQFGMIKLGSRTVLVLPKESGLSIDVKIGDKVKAGSSVVARYEIAN